MSIFRKVQALYEQREFDGALELVPSMLSQSRTPQALYLVACIHDSLSLEAEAIPFYIEAIEKGLEDIDLRGAYLGLGSTYRALGQYDKAIHVFDEAISYFPDAAELRVFRSMALYNIGNYKFAMSEVLNVLATTTSDPHVLEYKRALQNYAGELDRIQK